MVNPRMPIYLCFSLNLSKSLEKGRTLQAGSDLLWLKETESICPWRTISQFSHSALIIQKKKKRERERNKSQLTLGIPGKLMVMRTCRTLTLHDHPLLHTFQNAPLTTVCYSGFFRSVSAIVFCTCFWSASHTGTLGHENWSSFFAVSPTPRATSDTADTEQAFKKF